MLRNIYARSRIGESLWSYLHRRFPGRGSTALSACRKAQPAAMLAILGGICLLILRPDRADGVELSWLAPFRVPVLQATEASPFLFLAEEPLAEAQAIRSHLLALGQRLQADLGVALPATVVRIYIFDSRARYRRYLRAKHPNLAPRGRTRQAVFLLRDGQPHIFCVRGEKLVRDLRHELVHVVLNGSLRGLPIWLDEGLAEYYETGDPLGRHHDHLSWLQSQRRRGWSPNLARLEALTDFREMGQAEYAESWLWAHWLLHGSGDHARLLRDYLDGLRFELVDPPIGVRLANAGVSPPLCWSRHLDRLLAAQDSGQERLRR